VLQDLDVRATFAVNATLLDRIQPLIDAVRNAGHEIAAHGWDTDSIHWSGLEPGAERSLVERTRTAFDRAGLKPRIWMSPARQQSWSTLELVRAAGFDICLDWEVDTVPTEATTPAGAVALFPVLNELDDRTLLTVKNHSEDEWRDQILEAARYMGSSDQETGAQCFGLTLTPYVAGLPFRIKALREIILGLKVIGRVEPVGTILDNFVNA
jgi:peptidoglycan/xylan/chitin deacetylase (PgdA/CDA1 family)